MGLCGRPQVGGWVTGCLQEENPGGQDVKGWFGVGACRGVAAHRSLNGKGEPWVAGLAAQT